MQSKIKRGRIAFRTTEALEAALVAAAEYAGEKPSDYARRIMADHLAQQTPPDLRRPMA